MINSINANSVVLAEHYSSNTKKEVFETLTNAINLERQIGEAVINRDEVLKKDQEYADNVEGYASLKKYIHSKLDLLKDMNLNMATRAFSNDKTGLMLRVPIAPGFSDYVYFLKPKSNTLCDWINKESDVYILTPCNNPLVENESFFDVSFMYKVPKELL